MAEAGRPIPPPSMESYSGKWQFRAAKSLHRRLAERAKREGVRLNTLAVTLPRPPPVPIPKGARYMRAATSPELEIVL